MVFRSTRSRGSLGSLSRLSLNLFCFAMIASALPAFAQRSVAHVPGLVLSGGAKPTRILGPEEQLRFALILPGRNEAELDATIADIYNRQSPNYHRYLSVDEFAERFGPIQADYDTLKNYAAASGFEIVDTPRNRRLVYVRASVADVNRALHVTMAEFQHPSEPRTFYSPDREPTPDVALPGLTISGLDNFVLPRPGIHHGPEAVPAVNGSGPGGSYIGSDMRAIYYGGTQLTGAGQTVAIFSLDGIQTSDLTLYSKNTGMPLPVPVSLINVGGFNGACLPYSGDKSCDDGEQVIDVVSLEGVAPGLSQINFYQDTNPQALLSAIASDTSSKVVSISWTWSAANLQTDHSTFDEMAVQGQTVFHSSGDSGAFNSSTYGWPSDEGRIVQVGGTDLTTSGAGGSWSSETAWAHSGGGYSGNITIPDYQQQSGVITTQNGGSTQYRNSPDVAAEGNGDNYNCTNGVCSGSWYGTSIATPRWAGMIALANELGAKDDETAVGYINPTLYSLGLNPPANYPLPFHDIASGSNPPSSGTGSTYNAISGYDLVTGWGSPNSVFFIYELLGLEPPSFTLTPSFTTVQLEGGVSATTTITITPQNGEFVGAVNLSAVGLPSGVTASFSPASATTSSTLTLTASANVAQGSTSVDILGDFEGTATKTTITVNVLPAGSIYQSSYINMDGTESGGMVYPTGQMVLAHDGNLYGVSQSTQGSGTVFKLTPAGVLSALHLYVDYTDPLGGVPVNLKEGPDGYLYGLVPAGSATATPRGGLVRFSLATGQGSLVYAYQASQNTSGGIADPNGPYKQNYMTLGSDGKFYVYGEDANQDYDIYRISTGGTLETVYAGFVTPETPMLEKTPGVFYFFAPDGNGGDNLDTLTSAGKLTLVENLPQTYALGPNVRGTLAEEADGNIYGNYVGQFASNDSVDGLLKINSSNQVSSVYEFGPLSQTSGYPNGGLGLYPGSDGKFYISAPGSYTLSEQGMVYRLDTAGNYDVVQASIPDTNSDPTGVVISPSGDPVQGADGSLYVPSNYVDVYADGYYTSAILRYVDSPALAPAVQLSLSASTVNVGSAVTLTWKVLNAFSTSMQVCSAVAPAGAGSWSGLQSGKVSGGVYTGSATIKPTATGTYSYSLTCGGIESGSATLKVNAAGSKSSSSTALTVSPTTVQTGGSVTVTIKVTGSAGTPTGSATLLAGPNVNSLSSVGTVSLGSNGSVTFPASTSGYPIGKYVVEASYSGDSNYLASASSSTTITISAAKANSTTTVAVAPNPVVQNANLTLTATVKGSSPTGTVAYTGSGLSLGSAKVGSNGAVAPLVFPAQAPPGTYTLTASYSGDTANNPSSGTVSVRIAPAVKIVLTATPNPVKEGSSVTLTATLSGVGSSAVPTGTVKFEAYGINLEQKTLANGTASFSDSTAGFSGPYQVYVVYSGDSTYVPTQSAPITVTIN